MKIENLAFELTRKIAVPVVLISIGTALLFNLVKLPERIYLGPSYQVEYSDESPAYVFLSEDDKWRLPVQLDRIDPNYLKALIRYEDKRFYRHNGLDLLAIARAFITNIRKGRITSGASTLTMQLIRIINPRKRTYGSKLIEAFYSYQLEMRFTKDELLNMYLQFLPYGKNIEGIESACWAFFGHNASALSPFETAFLLAIPQNPNLYFPCEENYQNIRNAVNNVASVLLSHSVFSTKDYIEVINTAVPVTFNPYPRNIEHCAWWVKQQKLGNQNNPYRFTTTIRKDIQKITENIMTSYKDSLAFKGLNNGAAVVINNHTSEITALVGNFDFRDSENSGQIIGFDIPRSTGSTLKPFIYSLALDKGIIMPSQLVIDVPLRFGSYEPHNFQDEYFGLVPAQKALELSLNMPFLSLLREVSMDDFMSFMKSGGITSLIEKQGYYGLSIAIGGLELKLLELTNLYTIFRREGYYHPYIIGKDQPQTAYFSLISPGSAWLTMDALRQRERPGFEDFTDIVEIPPEIMWKTGTSQSHKDAWCIGSNENYTAGVWLGNFNSKSSPALEGARNAGPVLFDILTALSNRAFRNVSVEKIPEEIIDVEVCAYSGYLPNEACPETKKTKMIRTNIPTEKCPYHETFFIDRETGYHLPPLARQGREYDEKVYLLLPPSVRRWINDKNIVAREPPQTLPEYSYIQFSGPPRIIVPEKDTTYFLIPSVRADQQEIPLEAEAPNKEEELQWFLDRKFLQKSKPSERLWLYPEPGEHLVRVVKNDGKYDEVKISIL